MKVNIGCFTVMFKGWLNMDTLPMDRWAKENGFDFYRHDICYPLPFANECVDFIFASHVLEHVPSTDGAIFLGHCHRVMKKGAVMRIAVPDLPLLMKQYQDGTLNHLDAENPEVAGTPFMADKFWNILTNGHKAAYDFTMLNEMGSHYGFKVERKSFGDSHPVFAKECTDMFPSISLYAELTK